MQSVNKFIKHSRLKQLLVLSLIVITSPLFAADIFVAKKAFITSISSGEDKGMISITLANTEYAEVRECLNKTAYATSKKVSKGFENHRTLLMAAYLGGKEVSISVSGCVMDMPRIVSVKL